MGYGIRVTHQMLEIVQQVGCLQTDLGSMIPRIPYGWSPEYHQVPLPLQKIKKPAHHKLTVFA